MRLEIEKLHHRAGTTIIFVTHDQVEAMTLADHIVIMKDGHIQQVDTPTQVYRHSPNIFVAQFIGTPSMNLIVGKRVEGGMEIEGGKIIAKTPTGVGIDISVGVRSSDLTFVHEDDDALIEGHVSVIEPLGSKPSCTYI